MHSAAGYCTVHCSRLLHCTLFCTTVPSARFAVGSATVHCVLHTTALLYTVLHTTALLYTVLHTTALLSTASPSAARLAHRPPHPAPIPIPQLSLSPVTAPRPHPRDLVGNSVTTRATTCPPSAASAVRCVLGCQPRARAGGGGMGALLRRHPRGVTSPDGAAEPPSRSIPVLTRGPEPARLPARGAAGNRPRGLARARPSIGSRPSVVAHR